MDISNGQPKIYYPTSRKEYTGIKLTVHIQEYNTASLQFADLCITVHRGIVQVLYYYYCIYYSIAIKFINI